MLNYNVTLDAANLLTIAEANAGDSSRLTVALAGGTSGTYTFADGNGLQFNPPMGTNADQVHNMGTSITVAHAQVSRILINLGTGRDALTLGNFDGAIAPLTATDGGLAGDQVTVAAGGTGIEAAGDVALTGFESVAVNNSVTLTTPGASLNLAATGALTVNQGLTAANIVLAGSSVSLNDAPITATASAWLNGSGAANTLTVAYSAATTWKIDGANQGTVGNSRLVVPGEVQFSGFGHLVAGASATSFVFRTGGSLSGNLAGAVAGNTTLDYSALSTPTNVTLTGLDDGGAGLKGRGPGVGGTFDHVDNLIGGQGTNNSLTGFDSTDPVTFTITRDDEGTITARDIIRGRYAEFQNLIGGNAQHTFTFAGGRVTNSLDARANGALDFTQVANVNVSLTGVGSSIGFQGTAPAIIGAGFTNVNTFKGGAGSTLALNGAVTNNGFDLDIGGSLDATVNGTIAGTGKIVHGGHMFQGTGTVHERLVISQGTLHPGVSGPGTLTADDVTLMPQTSFQADLGGTGASLLDALGTVHLSPHVSLDVALLNGLQPALGQSFLVLQAADLQGQFQGLPNGANVFVDGLAFRINYQIGPDLVTQVVVTRTLVGTQEQVEATPPSPRYGDPVTLTATVSWPVAPVNANGITPMGTVTFLVDGTVNNAVPLTNGSATMLVTDLAPGPHTIRADFTDTGAMPNSESNSGSAMVMVGQPGHAPDLAFGGAGGRVRVEQFDQQAVADFAPFGTAYTGPITVALGDVNKDGVKDLVVAAGAGNPNVKVYNGMAFFNGTFRDDNPDASLLASFFPYALNFNVGANVAVGDVSGDGYADIITGATVGNPDVRVYSGKDIATGHFDPNGASLLAQWFPYGLNFNVGANVAVGRVTGSKYADVMTGATAGNPDVRVYRGQDIATGHFDPNGASLLAQFFPYALQFNVGAFVAVGDVNSDGYGDVITGASVGNADVRVYSGKAIAQGTFNANPDASQLDQFYAYALDQNIGATVAAADVEGPGPAGVIVGSTVAPQFRVFRGNAQGVEPAAIESGAFTDYQGFGTSGISVGA